jgi:hypothetical protein
MFNKTDIHGTWPTHPRVIMSACDSVYFDQFAERFCRSFQKKFNLPIHLHLINPTETQIALCKNWSVSWTCNYLDPFQMQKRSNAVIKTQKLTDGVAQRSVLWGFCQAVRFWLLGQYQTAQQDIVMCDIDCVAVQTPTVDQTNQLFSCTQFSVHKGRIMATFCAFSGEQLAQTQQLSHWIEQYDLDTGIRNGVDQLALKKCIPNPNSLPTGWISHDDTPTDKSVLRKINQNIIFHSKGTRGKSIDLSSYL